MEPLEDRRLLADFIVVNLDDVQDNGAGEGVVVSGSLRDAIIQASPIAGSHTIFFEEGLQGTIYLGQIGDVGGQLDLFSGSDSKANSISIRGPGSKQITIDASAVGRVFNISVDSINANAFIGGLTLTGGSAFGEEDAGKGGAIFNKERLTLTEVVVSASSATLGGGIFLGDSTSSLTLERSLITGNTSASHGGGLYIGGEGDDAKPDVTISNSTFAGNSAPDGYGGGLFNRHGETTIAHSTISGNSAFRGAGVASWGNVIYEGPGGPPDEVITHINSSIFSGNPSLGAAYFDVEVVGKDGEGDDAEDLGPSVRTQGYNIITMKGPQVPARSDDLPGVDPLLIGNPITGVSTLKDYGGSTDVFMPDTGSPAIDGGDPESIMGQEPALGDVTIPYFEQRGRHFTRIFDALGGGPIIDIGATEVQVGSFVVDVLVDELNGQFTANGFYDQPGNFTVREANDFSEKNPGIDQIMFSDLLRLEDDTDPFTPAPTLTLTEGPLQIAKSVVVMGPTNYELEINANQDGTRAFTIDDGDPLTFIDVTISDLTLLGANGVIDGSSIHSRENLTLLRSTLKNNRAAFQGGGVYAELGTLVVEGSTFLDNRASNQGGGIYIHASVPTARITNSTFSSNDADVYGGGLFNAGPATTLEYSTVTLNSSASTVGSGVLNDASTGVLHVHSTIVSGNINGDIDVLFGSIGSIVSDGYNLVGQGNAIGSFDSIGDRKLVLDPKLAPIELTGGPTPTHRVLEDSPALDTGDPAALAGAGGVPYYDQRGNPSVRVFDGSLSGTARIDIGAYELQETVYTVDTLADENDGDYSADNFSLREAIEVANVTASTLPETIIFSSSIQLPQDTEILLSTESLVPGTAPELRITDSLSILGPGYLALALDGAGLEGASIFTIDDGDTMAAVDVRIDGLTLQNSGGRAISSQENLSVDSLFLVDNAGGIAQLGATLTVNSTTMTRNIANSGGGLWIQDGELNMTASLFTANETVGVGSAGGGLYIGNSTATLEQTIISGNKAPGGSTMGGAIFIDSSTVLLEDSIISGNETTGSQSRGGAIAGYLSDITLEGTILSANNTMGSVSEGGGIFASGGNLSINSSTIFQNSTASNASPGGGIASLGGNLSVYQSTIGQNTTAGDDSDGGGIYQVGGNLLVRDSTVSGNEVSGDTSRGGGVFSATDLTGESTTRIINSTLSGNVATGNSTGANKSLSRGGGLYNAAGLTQIQHSTITDNQVPYQGQGGGVASWGDLSTTRTEVLSSIISANTVSEAAAADFDTDGDVDGFDFLLWQRGVGSGPEAIKTDGDADLNGTVDGSDLMQWQGEFGSETAATDLDYVGGSFTDSFQSLGYNLVGSGSAVSAGAFSGPGDQTDVNDPRLGPLTNNGGTTSTHEILEGSLAINAGDLDFDSVDFTPPMTTDQRGADRVQFGRIDVGAVESPYGPGLAADFDTDSDIDGFDFLLWQRGFGIGPGAVKSDGDANLDEFVDDLDLTKWQEDFGTTTTTAVAASTAASSSTIVVASAPAMTAALVAVEPPAPAGASSTVESFAVSPLALSVQPVLATTATLASSSRQAQPVALSSRLLFGLAGLTGLTELTGETGKTGETGETGETVHPRSSQGLDREHAALPRHERLRAEEAHRDVHDRLLADFLPRGAWHNRLLADDWIGTSRRLAGEQATEDGSENADLPLVEDTVFDILGSAGI